jgi:hypothetical protein
MSKRDGGSSALMYMSARAGADIASAP